jgi:ribosome recycling factor
MNKSLDVSASDLAKIRTGASLHPDVLAHLTIDYYGNSGYKSCCKM